MAAHDKETLYDFHYTERLGSGRNVVNLERHIVVKGLTPRRVIVPHSFYNVNAYNDTLIVFTDSGDIEGSSTTLKLTHGNYTFDDLVTEVTALMATIPVVVSSMVADRNGHIVWTTDRQIGINPLSTTAGLLGYPDYPSSGPSFFSPDTPPNYVLTSYRAANLVTNPIIKMWIDGTDFIINTFGGYGTYIFQDFPDNEGFQFNNKRSAMEVYLTDVNDNYLDLHGYD